MVQLLFTPSRLISASLALASLMAVPQTWASSLWVNEQNVLRPVALEAARRLGVEPDPRAAWPGNPAKLEALSGGWRPTHSARLAEWGPAALGHSGGAWLYNRHISAMTKVTSDA